MKKPLFSLICAVALLFSSCSKEEPAAPKDEEMYPVTFNVSTFSKEIVPMASTKKTAKEIAASTATGKPLSDAIQYLNYYVYNESGTKVNSKLTRNSEPTFGKIEDSLPKGKYFVVVTGSAEWYPNITDYYYGGSVGFHSQPGDDIFFAQTELEIDGGKIDRTIDLVRKVGKIEFELTDQIPSDISQIVYTVNNISTSFSFEPNLHQTNSASNSNNIYYTEGELTHPEQEHSLYFFLVHDESSLATVNIRAYTLNGNLVVDKMITDIPAEINKKTILTGRLFDDVGGTKGQAFSITVDDEWNSESNHIEF